MSNLLNNIWLCIAVAAIAISGVVSGADAVMLSASLIGIIFVVGVARGWVHCQAFGAVLACFIGYFSYQAGFYGNMAINLFYVLPMSLVGWCTWIEAAKTGKVKKEIRVNNRPKAAIIILATFALCLGISFFTGSVMPIHDGISTALLIVATFMLAVGFREQWYFWIPYNALEVFMWFTAVSSKPEMLAVLAMRVVFLINSLIGWYNWHKK